MGEVINFPERGMPNTLTAHGRFLLAAINQEMAAEKERKLRQAANKPKPTPAQIRAAKKELDHLFTGENAKISEQLYNEGLDDLVRRRTPQEEKQIHFLLPNDYVARVMMVTATARYTAATLFYIHIETLTGIANQAYDHTPNTTNTARTARLIPPDNPT